MMKAQKHLSTPCDNDVPVPFEEEEDDVATRSITPEDLYRFKLVGDPQVSPDGQRIAYIVKTIEKELNKYRTAIWMAPVAGGLGAATRFTADGASPRWSPDGQTLAFVSDRPGTLPEPNEGESGGERDKRCGKGKGQIWLIPASGGEARQLTFAKHGASNPTWSPDGQRLAFTADTGDEPEIPEHDGKPEPRSHRITRMVYRFNGQGYVYELRTHLFVVAASGGEAQQITDGDWDDGHPAWSPDGKTLAFNSDRSEDRWRWGHGEVWLVNDDGSNPRPLLAIADHDFQNPAWSPDGTLIATQGSKRHDGQHVDIYVVASAGGEPRNLTAQQFIMFDDAIGGDMRNDHGDPTPRWSPDGKALFLLGNARGAGNVYVLDVESEKISEVTTGLHHVLGYSVDNAANTFAVAVADTQQPGDIFVYWRGSSESTRLTDVNAEFLSELVLSQPEQFTFRGANDWEIEGWILKPQDFHTGMRYPMVLEIHGGPNTSYGYSFHHEMQVLAGKGFVVVYTNPRGSTSYGREFSQAVEGIWGKEDYEDVMAAVDAVLAKGYVDPERLGVTGGSYGGFMTNWIIGHNDRFKAAVTARSVTSLTSMYGTTDIGMWFDDLWGGPPWEQEERYKFHSPLTYVKDMHTPLLIIHSDEDWRCPIEQAEQLFIALKWLRREVEFLRFESQSHDLTRNGHPRLRIEHMNATADWFTDHIPTAASAPAAEQVAEPSGAPIEAE